MGKKTAFLLSVLLFVGILFFSLCDIGKTENPEALKKGSLSGQARQAVKLLETFRHTLDTEEVRLCFRGEELAADKKTRSWYLPVDMDSGGWEEGAFTASGEEIEILPLQDYTLLDKRTVVAQGTQIPFLAWKEKEAVCAVVYVVFTGLAVVRIETDANLDKDTAFAGSAVFYEACANPDWTMSSAFEAHERGQTTRMFPKKGYRLNLVTVTAKGSTFENPRPVFGMRDSDSWIFYAIYSDGTKARDKLNIELWNGFGASGTGYEAHFGTHMEYAELFVNEEYRGLYGILEPVDSDQLRITEEEYLYKRTFGRKLLSELFDEAQPQEYLSVLGVEIKGKDGFGTARDWQCFRRFVKMCELEDEAFREEAENLLNLENAADLWLYLQMIYGEDNIYKNMFFAFKKEASGYRLCLVPWDTDLTWGNVYVDDGKSLYTTHKEGLAQEYLSWPLLDRLLKLNVGGIRDKAAARWEALRKDALSDARMEAILQECIHQVQDSGAFARDAARWPKSGHDGDYDGIRAFMKKRMIFLDKYMENMKNME